MKYKKLQKELQNYTLLYIEDEKEIRENLLLTLNLIFKNVAWASNAENALDIFNNNPPDIILSDINLPNMSGLEFIKELRKTNFHLPVILLTAYTDLDMLLEANRLHLVNYLIKPIVFDELFLSFETALEDIKLDKKHILQFQDKITYDINKKLLKQNGIVKELTLKEQKLLDIFTLFQGETISIEEIKSKLWENSLDATDAAFKSVLHKLRVKIGSNSIKHINKIGYHLNFKK